MNIEILEVAQTELMDVVRRKKNLSKGLRLYKRVLQLVLFDSSERRRIFRRDCDYLQETGSLTKRRQGYSYHCKMPPKAKSMSIVLLPT
ncbi:hypothetical protein CSA56_16500 [candidate division KSB3 bacterium]|uniref:Uncharacterized protein n=1 Tax=candidate division KSB3 bacterium TaxID=2044937 RepID=A0A2G6K8R1_9BACT|nr:MAG: hypothetical protein CSA56_16500 [candidate division KSB3 bacterium]